MIALHPTYLPGQCSRLRLCLPSPNLTRPSTYLPDATPLLTCGVRAMRFEGQPSRQQVPL